MITSTQRLLFDKLVRRRFGSDRRALHAWDLLKENVASA